MDRDTEVEYECTRLLTKKEMDKARQMLQLKQLKEMNKNRRLAVHLENIEVSQEEQCSISESKESGSNRVRPSTLLNYKSKRPTQQSKQESKANREMFKMKNKISKRNNTNKKNIKNKPFMMIKSKLRKITS